MSLSRPGRAAVLSLSLAAALTTVANVPAQAGAPTRIDAAYWGVDCVYAVGGGDTLFLFGSGTTDGTEGGVGAFVEDADGGFVAEGWTDAFTYGDSFTTSFVIGDEELVLDAGLTAGETTTEQIRERSGNSWTTGATTMTDLEVAPRTLTYRGAEVGLSGGSCAGEVTGFDVTTTNPAATIYRHRDFFSDICDVDGLPDAQVRLSGSLPDLIVEVVADHGGESVEKLAGDLTVKGGGGSVTADVVDLYTGEVATSGTVAVDLTRVGHRTREVESFDGIVETQARTLYRAEVTVTFADGRQGTATCAAVATTSRVWIGPHAAI